METYNTLASSDSIKMVTDSLEQMNVKSIVVKNGKEALNKIIELIPTGATVMNGTSKTLEQIGYIDYLKNQNKWSDLHKMITDVNDPEKRKRIRKESINSDYYIGSVHAISLTGEFIIASNTGSQLPYIAYTSQNLIFIVSSKKIVKNLSETFNRLIDYVVPQEDARMRELYGIGTYPNKILIFNGENIKEGRNILMLIVEENLGF